MEFSSRQKSAASCKILLNIWDIISTKKVYIPCTSKKVEAVQRVHTAHNLKELRSFLGLVHFYGKFIPNLSTILQPINQLLQKGRRWSWTPAYGLRAVISHLFPNGTEKPVAYASRSLSPAEKKYAQLEKEALSLIFGIYKFHQYLYGRKFQLVTDHKPLTTILGSQSRIPSLAAARLQRWALICHPTTMKFILDQLKLIKMATVCHDCLWRRTTPLKLCLHLLISIYTKLWHCTSCSSADC